MLTSSGAQPGWQTITAHLAFIFLKLLSLEPSFTTGNGPSFMASFKILVVFVLLQANSFLIYINGLENNIKSNVKFFSDDTMLLSIVKDPTTSADELNHDLQTISELAHQWKLEFNPDPHKQTTELLFSPITLLFFSSEVRSTNTSTWVSFLTQNYPLKNISTRRL